MCRGKTLRLGKKGGVSLGPGCQRESLRRAGGGPGGTIGKTERAVWSVSLENFLLFRLETGRWESGRRGEEKKGEEKGEERE